MRSGRGASSRSSRKDRVSGGVKYGLPGAGRFVTSSAAALSRTDRVSTCSCVKPSQPSTYGHVGLRPRDGLKPKTPQQDAGMRIDPPPSPPLAIGTRPAATAAAEPPEDPPAVRVR